MGLTSSKEYNLSNHVCSWQGVVCDTNQNVIKLIASGLSLSGLIPDNTIGKLGKLQFLDLSNNKITGLPSDFWSLGSLKSLNLSYNRVSGNLPGNVGNFGLLESLDLSSNSFSGSIPEAIGSLVRLQVIYINKNGFQSSIPLGVLSCHSLIHIDFSSNKLNGSLPHGFGAAFLKLKSLNIANNAIHGRDSDLSKLTSVSYLNVSRNLFQGSMAGVFQEPLEVIDLSRNQFQGHISQINFNSNFNWSRLVFLDLSDNQLSGEFPEGIRTAKNLRHLSLAHNRYSEQQFPQINMLLALEYLNLSHTNLHGHIASSISMLSSLRTLDISKNHLIGCIPHFDIRNLQVIDVSSNNLSGDIPQPLLRKLEHLERFNFSYNHLTLCTSVFSPKIFQSAFVGSSNICPIAAKPGLLRRQGSKRGGRLKLAVILTISMVCLFVGLLLLAFGCRRKTRMWVMKQNSYREQQTVSGPFSFQTDSTTWVADVKLATSVPVVIFEKPLHKFTFADLLSATSDFDRATLLAEGRFGPVYGGFLPGGIHVAVKVLVHGSSMTDQEAAKEFEYLGRIKHPNLVPLTGYCLAGEQRIAIYDYMENGNLKNLLHDLPLGVQTTEDWSTDTWEEDDNDGIQNVRSEGLLTTWRFRHKIALGTARALAFLHHGCSPPIIHRDIKSTGVYLDSDLEPRISDFGLAKIFGDAVVDELPRGSSGYVPPEHLQVGSSSSGTSTPKSDVYGFGIVLFELITGKKPVGDNYPEEKEGNLVSWVRALVRMNKGSIAIDPKIQGTGLETRMNAALKIGYLCTSEIPSKRPSMHQVVGLLKDIEPIPPQ